MNNHHWLKWAQKLQALAQTGLYHTENPYDTDRYLQLLDVTNEIFQHHTKLDKEIISAIFNAETGYATPKIDVRGAVFKDDSILLVQEQSDANKWTLPGGWADVGDSPSEAVEREILEESGYTAVTTKVIAILDRNKHGHTAHPFHSYKLYFLCELAGNYDQSKVQKHETSNHAFFSRDEIPTNVSLGRVTEEMIAMCFRHHFQPDLPTEFD